MKAFEILDHTADIGLLIRGRDLRELFENAGKGFFHLITDMRRVRERLEKRIEIGQEPLERLMVDWLNELLYFHDVENLLLRTFKMESVGKGGLKAVVKGESFREGVHVVKTEIKAVTYHQIQVQKEDGLWKARVIFDL